MSLTGTGAHLTESYDARAKRLREQKKVALVAVEAELDRLLDGDEFWSPESPVGRHILGALMNVGWALEEYGR